MLAAISFGTWALISKPAGVRTLLSDCNDALYELDLHVFSLKLQIRTYFAIEVIAQPLWITRYQECLTVSLSITQGIGADNHLVDIR